MQIRRLRASDDRTDFRSGDPDLDRFFAVFAGQNQFRHYVGTTYVAVERNRVRGFVSVAPGHIEIDDLPAAVRRGLPRYPLPILRLARLAVDARVSGRGLGRALLRFVLELSVTLAVDYGCIGVVVDAKPAAVRFYERFGFVALDVSSGQSDARPQPQAMFLSVAAIRRATGGAP